MKTEEQVEEDFEYSEKKFGLLSLTHFVHGNLHYISGILIDPSGVHKGLLLSSSQYSTYVVNKCRVGYSIFTG